MNADEAKQRILSGTAPAGMEVAGRLDFTGDTTLQALPTDLTVRSLALNGCTALRELPAGLRCNTLELRGSPLITLPADLAVAYRLDLGDCAQLTTLPHGLTVGSLILSGCTALRALPEDLAVYFLDISGCTALTEWPTHASISVGRLNMRGCVRLRALPTWLTQLAQLDVSGCADLTSLPEHLHVSSWLDLANTGITALPPALDNVQLRWRDVPITARIAFHPETITAQEIIDEPNAELRRVLLERFGYEAFMEQAAAEMLDEDVDPGGRRRLLRVPMTGDEPLVGLAVSCPSTARHYFLRVPPKMQSCHQAAAWIAGFDNPADYHPLAET